MVVDVRLQPEDFYRDSHRAIFRAILDAQRRRTRRSTRSPSAPSSRSAASSQTAGGKAYVYQLAAAVPTAGNARHYAKLVKEQATLRRLLDVSQEIQISVADRRGEPRELVEDAERKMFEVAHAETPGDFRSIEEILHEQIDKLEQLSRDGQSVTGTPSGFQDLDDITGGFQQSNLIVLAARPSMGKSALVTNIAENVAVKHERPVALFSLEMSETELAQRFVASQARISGDKLRKGQVARERLAQGRARRARRSNKAPLWIDDSSDIDILELRAKARRLHAKRAEQRGGLGLDHRRLPPADAGRSDRPTAGSSRSARSAAGSRSSRASSNVPVIAVSQLNRAPEQRPGQAAAPVGPPGERPDRAGRRPRDVHLPRRVLQPGDRERQGIAEISIAKHRNGPVGHDVELTFLERYPKFANIAPRESRRSSRSRRRRDRSMTRALSAAASGATGSARTAAGDGFVLDDAGRGGRLRVPRARGCAGRARAGVSSVIPRKLPGRLVRPRAGHRS